MQKTLKSYVKEYLLAEYDYITKYNSDEVIRPLRGIDRIDDFWLLEELIQYDEEGNYDRFVSFAAAVMITKIYQQNRLIKRRSEVKVEKAKVMVKPPISLIGGDVPKKRTYLL